MFAAREFLVFFFFQKYELCSLSFPFIVIFDSQVLLRHTEKWVRRQRNTSMFALIPRTISKTLKFKKFFIF